MNTPMSRLSALRPMKPSTSPARTFVLNPSSDLKSANEAVNPGRHGLARQSITADTRA
jgi:hypothetical protein